jgi:hypothetical protein
MNYEHTAESQLADGEYDQALNDSQRLPAGAEALRRQRLEEYEMAGLERSNHLVAVLTPITAGLIDDAHNLHRAITMSLRKLPAIDDFARLEGPWNMYLRVVRQIDRFANLETRVEAAETQAKNAAKSRTLR